MEIDFASFRLRMLAESFRSEVIVERVIEEGCIDTQIEPEIRLNLWEQRDTLWNMINGS